MLIVPLDDLTKRLPRPLDPDESSRAEVLLKDAAQEIMDAIADAGYRPEEWLSESRNSRRALRVARAVVAEAILIGEDIGKTSVSTGTGPFSDSATFHGTVQPPHLWGEVELSDDHLNYLGLGIDDRGGPRWSFPPPLHFPGDARWPWNR